MSEGVAFGNYRLLRRLARGGMAEVFLARQQGVEGFERRVAIKRILPHLSDSAEFRTMFLDEARLAAQLSHPNIIHIYDFGKVEDYYFIAMEYVDGVDLGRLIKQARTTPVPFELIARVLSDICAGLHYAHNISDNDGKRLNVVHRDVTPQNVLVTYDGVVKVVDFGIAKATWQANRTRPGVVKGKYAYMSPEQVEGRSLDARSDVFSVGICMYEVMTGTPLFRRDNVTEAMKEIRDGKPIHPEQHRADVPPELMAVMKHALEISRDARYPSAAAMQLDLERYLKNAVALATPQLIGDFLRKEAPRTSEGEILVEARPGSGDEIAPRPTPEPPRVATGAIVKGGTAQISSLKQAVTPAYEIPSPLGSGGSAPTGSHTEDLTTPGKSMRGSGSSSPAVPAAPGGAPRGFAEPGDDELTRRDDRIPPEPTASHDDPTTRAAKLTPPAGERPVTGSERRATSPPERSGSSGQLERAGRSNPQERVGRSGQHERPSRSGPFPGSPLGSDTSAPMQPPVLSTDPTAMLVNPPLHPERRIPWLMLGLVLLVLGGGAFAMRRLIFPDRTTPPRDATKQSQADKPDLRTAAAVPPVLPVTAERPAGDLKPATEPTPKVVTTELPVQTSATIGIYTRPSGAKVFIDGEALGALTPIRMQPITAGPHHVVIERTGCQPREVDVTLRAGEHHVLDYELPEERSLQGGTSPTSPNSWTAGKKKPPGTHTGGNGFLTAKTIPWSRAFDGPRLLGETPVVNVPLSEGPHTITFVNPDKPVVKKKVLIRVGEETKLNFSLSEP